MTRKNLLRLLKLLHDNIDLMYSHHSERHHGGLCHVTSEMRVTRHVINYKDEEILDAFIESKTNRFPENKMNSFFVYGWKVGDVDRRMYWLKDKIRKIEKKLSDEVNQR